MPDPAPFGSEADRELVKQVWSDTRFQPDPLADAVSLEADSDGFAALTVLALVPERALGNDLVLSLRDAKGGERGQERVSSGHLVGADNPLPPSWVDPGGPWADPVERAGRIAARVAATAEEGLYLVLVSLRELPDEIHRRGCRLGS